MFVDPCHYKPVLPFKTSLPLTFSLPHRPGSSPWIVSARRVGYDGQGETGVCASDPRGRQQAVQTGQNPGSHRKVLQRCRLPQKSTDEGQRAGRVCAQTFACHFSTRKQHCTS